MAAIAETALAKADIRLNTVVEYVHNVEIGEGNVQVKTMDGITHHFDEVVLTTPLGWLKLHKGNIQPLAPRISEAIDSISYGRLEKVSQRRLQSSCRSFANQDSRFSSNSHLHSGSRSPIMRTAISPPALCTGFHPTMDLFPTRKIGDSRL